MMPNDIEREIERLKMEKIELANKMNISTDFDEREELQLQIERINSQIDILEKFKKK